MISSLLLALAMAGVDTPKPFDPCLSAGVRDTVLFIGTKLVPPESSP